MGGLRRVVVAGSDKEDFANWVSEVAEFDHVRRIVYVLCKLRLALGLPLPAPCPLLPQWLKQLSEEPPPA